MKQSCTKNLKSLKLLFLTAIILTLTATAQKPERVEPPFWWTGFQNNSLQLLVYGKDISLTAPSINNKGIVIKQIHKVSNPNYLFIDLELLPGLQPGTIIISFERNKKEVSRYTYKILPRDKELKGHAGFSSADAVYLLMPDRFANGDTSNDSVPGMLESAHRENPGGRHGGDLKGIIDHVDYLKEMGFTALWCTPFLENDMKPYSYHGYSATDHYRTDRRFGTNEDYRRLADTLHSKGMKLIMDVVINHCGVNHWWMKDLPSEDWLHQFPVPTNTSYRIGTQSDPYVSNADKVKFRDGWFNETMPDLNQDNPYLAKYLVQNTIWWLEFSGVDGIRVDTYPYCNKEFMNTWDKAVMLEYPHLNIVGECWATSPESIAYWQKGSHNRDGFRSELPAVIDFAMYDALRLGFMEQPGWSTGIHRLYDILSKDFIYPDPLNIMTFADNHDVGRYLASQDQDVSKLKLAMVFLLTSRGIPQIFYGTEALITTKGESNNEKVRQDFPGGWKNDSTDFFNDKGLTPARADMKSFMKNLLNWRKGKTVIHQGKLTHFLPSEGLYVFFRHNEKETVMVILNNDKNEKTIDRSRYAEFLDRFTRAEDVISGKKFNELSDIRIQAGTAMILELF